MFTIILTIVINVIWHIKFHTGFAIPFHSHVGINYVISDYGPKAHRLAARGGLLFATVLTLAGIFKLNFDGPGLTGTLKSLWMKPEDVKKK